MRAGVIGLLIGLVLTADARAVAGEHDVAVNSRGGVVVAWIEVQGRFSELKVAQGALDGEMGPPRVIATASRADPAGDFGLAAPQVELFDNDSLLLIWRRVRYANSAYDDTHSDVVASVDYGPEQVLARDARGFYPVHLATDPSGWAVATWSNNGRLEVARRAPGEAQVRVEGAVEGMGEFPEAGIAANGDAVIVSTRPAGPQCQVVALGLPAGGGLAPLQVVDSVDSCAPNHSVAVGGGGAAAVLYLAGREIRGALGNTGGFGPPQRVLDGGAYTPRGSMTAQDELLALGAVAVDRPASLVRWRPGEGAFTVEPTTLPSVARAAVSRSGAIFATAQGSDHRGYAFRRPAAGEFGPAEALSDRGIGLMVADPDGAVSFNDSSPGEQRLVLARWPGGSRAPDIVLSRTVYPPLPPPPPPTSVAILATPDGPVRLRRGRFTVRVHCYPHGPGCRSRLTLRVLTPRSRRGRLVARWSGTLRPGATRTLRLRPRRAARPRRMLAELRTSGTTVADRRILVLRR